MESPDDARIEADGSTLVDVHWWVGGAIGLAAVSLVVTAHMVSVARDALTWVSLGTLIAVALESILIRLERLLRYRWAAVLALSGLALIFGTVLLTVVFPVATREAGKFDTDVPRLVERLDDLPVIGGRLVDADVPARLERWVQGLPANLGVDDAPLQGLFRSVLDGVTALLATVLVSIAVMLDGNRLRRGVLRIISVRRRDDVVRAFDILYRTVGRYFAGSILVALSAGVAILIVGLLAGVPLAPVAAVWVTMTNLIPQIGGFLGGSLFIVLGATQGPTTLLICLGWFLAYQQFENNVLQPMIVGDAVDLSPPTTMIAALVGASAFGVPGALIAVPLLGAGKAILIELGLVSVGASSDGAAAKSGPLRRAWGRKPNRARR